MVEKQTQIENKKTETEKEAIVYALKCVCVFGHMYVCTYIYK